MSRVNWLILIAVTLTLIFIGGYIYLKPLFKPLLVMTDQPLMTKEDVEKARALAAQQNEDAFLQWEFQKEKYKKKNELKMCTLGICMFTLAFPLMLIYSIHGLMLMNPMSSRKVCHLKICMVKQCKYQDHWILQQ